MMRALGWPLIIIVSALGATLVVIGDIGAPLRPIIIFWFVLVCPGMAFVRLLRLEERITELTLAVALSVTLGTIVAEVMVLNRIWSPQGGLFVLVGLSLSGTIWQIVQLMADHRGRAELP